MLPRTLIVSAPKDTAAPLATEAPGAAFPALPWFRRTTWVLSVIEATWSRPPVETVRYSPTLIHDVSATATVTVAPTAGCVKAAVVVVFPVGGRVRLALKYGPPGTFRVSVPPAASAKVSLTGWAPVLKETARSAVMLKPFVESPAEKWAPSTVIEPATPARVM